MIRVLAGLLGAVSASLTVAELTGHGLRRTRRQATRRGPTRQEWLSQAGATITPGQLWSVTALCGLLTTAAVLLVTRTLVVSLLPGMAVGALPWAYFARERRTRSRERIAAWPDAIRTVVAGVEASTGLHQALAHLAESGPMALRPTFARYAAVAGAVDQRAGLEVVRGELADPVSDSVVEVLLQAMDRGPAVALAVLRDLADDVSADLQALERSDTLALEQKLNARAAFVLPYVILAVLCLRSGPFRDFYRSSAGLAVALFGGGLSITGLLIVDRLGRPTLGERLFTGDRTKP